MAVDMRSGWNHSGRNGPINFMNGVMGIVNGQRTLNIVRALAGFICLPENSEVREAEGVMSRLAHNATCAGHSNVYDFERGVHQDDWNRGVTVFVSHLHEGLRLIRANSAEAHSYLEAYKVVRGVCGYGAGNGPVSSGRVRGLKRLLSTLVPRRCSSFTTDSKARGCGILSRRAQIASRSSRTAISLSVMPPPIRWTCKHYV